MIEIVNSIGPLGLPLAVLSCIGLALILERFFFFLRLPATQKSPVLQSLLASLEKNRSQPKAIRDELVTYLLSQSKDHYFCGVRFLRLIAVLSPMIGLLGTVMGIIDAFKIISQHDGPVYPSLIADGLWVAMLTTAVGLMIALPCLFFAFVFARIAQRRLGYYQNALNRASLAIEGVACD